MHRLIHILCCLFILWSMPKGRETRYEIINSYASYAACKAADSPINSASGGKRYYVCLPDTMNPNRY